MNTMAKIHPGGDKILYRTRMPILYNIKETLGVNLNISGTRAISLLFYVHKEIEYNNDEWNEKFPIHNIYGAGKEKGGETLSKQNDHFVKDWEGGKGVLVINISESIASF